MTTPAQNINNVLTRPGRRIITPWPTGTTTVSVVRNVKYDWFKKVRPASGSVPIDPVTGWRNCRTWSHMGHDFNYPSNRVVVEYSYGSYGSHQAYDDGSYWNVTIPGAPSMPSGLVSRAEMKALEKLKNQDFHLGTFLAEFGKTEQMIASRIRTIAKQVNMWRRRNPKQLWEAVKRYERGGCGRRLVDRIPGSWLELQYGWKPLLSDIYGAIALMDRDGPALVASVKGYAEEETRFEQTVAGEITNSRCKLHWKVKHQVWVRLWYRLINPGLALQSSLGLLNPAEIVWEIVPYSFVVDWLVPIGPWLGSLTADAGYQFIGGSRSKLTTYGDATGKDGVWPTSAYQTYSRKDLPRVNGSGFNFERYCYPSSPVPGLYVKNPLSALHVANATALLVQAFK